MSYEFDTAIVVDKATAKRLAKDCQDIFYGVTMIATDRYFLRFCMKWGERYEAILDEVRNSSYYEIMKVGEELDDIKFECGVGSIVGKRQCISAVFQILNGHYVSTIFIKSNVSLINSIKGNTYGCIWNCS